MNPLLMEQTEKFFIRDEDVAERLVESYKEKPNQVLVDWKISLKETKDSIYYIVTLKTRFYTLAEAKESM